MTSSSKRKKEKKKDFQVRRPYAVLYFVPNHRPIQKVKLKVGKAKPKPSNYTDTSFSSKAIVLAEQSLRASAPSSTSQFNHHVSLLSSRSDSQRKDSLNHLTSTIANRQTRDPLPQPLGTFLPKILPLVLDASTGIRTQLLKLLQALPRDEVEPYADQISLYVRAGLTHLAVDIRRTTLDILDWAIVACATELVDCPGGWLKTLKTFLAMLGWSTTTDNSASTTSNSAWSGKSTLSNSDKISAKTLKTLGAFLEVGLLDANRRNDHGHDEAALARAYFPLRQTWMHMVPEKSHAYRHLNLFGAPRDEENEIYGDVDARQQAFGRYQKAFEEGLEEAKRAGGEIGRAGARASKVIAEALKGVSDV